MLTAIILFVLLLAVELVYFRIADRCDIIDQPNFRSSHTRIVIRGGGIIFPIAMWLWAMGHFLVDMGFDIQNLWFLIGLTLVAFVSYVDDIRGVRYFVRLQFQFLAMAMLFYQLFLCNSSIIDQWPLFRGLLFIAVAWVACVGMANVINFMDGINGITAAYSLSVLVPLVLVNRLPRQEWLFVDPSLLSAAIVSVVVFSLFNFRPSGKARCFAGDVGSLSIAMILLFCLGNLIVVKGDVTWIVLLLVYIVDGGLTIVHRILLNENIFLAHRKHAYQLMANELKIPHPVVSLLYAVAQLLISLGFIYLCPDTRWGHWIYLLSAALLLAVAYVLFIKRYYHLHEEYLRSLQE